MKRRKILSLLIALALIISIAPASLAAAGDEYATRGEIVDMLLTAADDYNPDIARSDIIRGDEGGLREDDYVTRAEAFVMVSRAFGELDAPTGHNARVTLTDLYYNDVPEWAVADVENLVRGGVLVGTGDGRLSPQNYVTAGQVRLMISRIWMLKAENLRDSFFATVNSDTLNSLTISPGQVSAGTLNTLSSLVTDQIMQIINEAVSGSNAAGSNEQKIADFYLSVADIEGRNAAGNEPIQAYLDVAEEIETMDDLIALRTTLLNETGVSALLFFAPSVDAADSTKYTMYFGSAMRPSLPKEYYGGGYESVIEIYQNYIAKIFEISGLDADKAALYAGYIVGLEAAMASRMLDTQDYGNIDLVYNKYTMSELQALFPSIDLSEILSVDGYKAESYYIVSDTGLLEAFAEALESAGAEELRAYARYSVAGNFASCLSQDYTDAGNNFSQLFYGMEGSYTSDEMAVLYTQSVMADFLGETYIDRHFSAEAKADVENMVRDFIEIYKDRIQALDWMSDATKQMALKKLDTMSVKIGYPDTWESIYDSVTIKRPSDGGSFYSNIVAMTLAGSQENVSLQGTEVDKDEWLLSAYTVNAYYNPSSNEIVFPAGILQSPFYDINASHEENLGGIGFVIAHEITHCFDNNGAKYDENGNAANWWTQEDYARFNELCRQVVEFYDGLESAPGIVNSGVLTLSENIADLGAIACVVQAAEKMESADFEKLFLNLAECWAQTGSREYMALLSQMDVHSANSIRADRAAQSTNKFYETFGIEPGDGMYLAPEARVSIW